MSVQSSGNRNALIKQNNSYFILKRIECLVERLYCGKVQAAPADMGR